MCCSLSVSKADGRRNTVIHELLSQGASNAVPGRELAGMLELDTRAFTKQVERERQSGAPICAVTTGTDKGYFLAADVEELSQYCKSLDRRLKNLRKTRNAVGDTLTKMMKQTEMEGW